METNSARGVLFVPPCPQWGCQGYICSPASFLDGSQRPLECKGKRYSGWRELDEVLGTYIFHCLCQALHCLLSLVSQSWCFLKLPLVEGGVLQSKVSGCSVVFHFF